MDYTIAAIRHFYFGRIRHYHFGITDETSLLLLQGKNVLFLAKQECPVFMLLLVVALFLLGLPFLFVNNVNTVYQT